MTVALSPEARPWQVEHRGGLHVGNCGTLLQFRQVGEPAKRLRNAGWRIRGFT
jgi:hypothetical protein